MKNKIKPTNKEIIVNDSDLLISKSDPKGIITYVNNKFSTFSGYAECELIGQQHNIIRHPDMPRVIFKLLWTTIQSNREFNGYTKNLTKDGSYYWVFANVTPSFSADNNLLGYFSVRRKPDQNKLSYIKSFYAELLEIEKQAKTSVAIDESMNRLNAILNAKEVGYDEFILTI